MKDLLPQRYFHNAPFRLVSNYQLCGDQPQAVAKLSAALTNGVKHNVLLGATGTGKTFTIANVIQKYQKSTLIISHNKTLAMQLYSEFKTLFPHNKVEYFISPFDFYKPEAYLPHADLYIDKSVKWNFDVKAMRIATLNALTTTERVIVIASVAAIYGVLDPEKYRHFIRHLVLNTPLQQREFVEFLVNAGYERTKFDCAPGKFLVRGALITLGLVDETDVYLRIKIQDDKIIALQKVAAVTFKVLANLTTITLYPAQEYVIAADLLETACKKITKELTHQLATFKTANEFVKRHRLKIRTEQDLDNLRQLGYCKGIENYAFHLENRLPGSLPFTLLDHFPPDFLVVIDESHITLPQIHGMYVADYNRKKTLVDYGFRLPSALENRPLRFHEFNQKINRFIYVSATPSDYELEQVKHRPVEQLIRPTGLLDPVIEICPTKQQIPRLISEITAAIAKQQRTFVLTLTIKMAEDLTEYLQTQQIKVAYLHNKLKTFERTKILINFRKGVFDVVVGINLLREGLDIPEVGLVCILDAAREGFLRSRKSLIQMIGRAARNAAGRVLLFADQTSQAMEAAITETTRRRNFQMQYNTKHNIVPQTIQKPIQDIFLDQNLNAFYTKLQTQKASKLTRVQTKQMIKLLQKKLQIAVRNQDFELAAKIRDMVFDLMEKKSF